MSQRSAATGRRILAALWLQDRDAAIARAAVLAAAIVADHRAPFGVGPTWQRLSEKLGIPLLGGRRSKARAVKQGMMQELLTGRTRLPVAGVAP